MNHPKHNRKSMRLEGYDYSYPGAYFVTVCTWDRECLFGRVQNEQMHLNELGRIVEEEWIISGDVYNYIGLDLHVVMPNHFHGVVLIDDHDNIVGTIHESSQQKPTTLTTPKQRRKMILPKFMGRFKMQSSKRINQLCNKSGTPVWQKSFYDHIIRNEDDWNRVREYIINNPLKWALDRFHTTM